ncbi:MAG: nucleoside triphosphate pyrophosphohydrolase family protein [Candidatus Pacebacteria bacterium]|nr:nucleoside triphosphate pyrophosphohydrolase family protein [Candidatus Paceibacterota bacterium]MDR3583308.1 nucleoside triphosphate pyrophosphohydrolase family protein [Candidatus Paceibacterota bacterium]
MKKYYDATKKFHRKFKMKGTNNEDMGFRLNLMTEELGELAQAVTRGKSRAEIFEENIDLLNLILGNFVSLGAKLSDIDKVFWQKHEKIMNREIKTINGKLRVSHYGNKKLR